MTLSVVGSIGLARTPSWHPENAAQLTPSWDSKSLDSSMSFIEIARGDRIVSGSATPVTMSPAGSSLCKPLSSASPDACSATLLRRTRSFPDRTSLLESEKTALMTSAPYILDPSICLEDIAPFKHAGLLFAAEDRRVYVLDDRYALKLMRPELDVDTIVSNMKKAATVVRVPAVHRAGRGLSCTFILMDYIPARTMDYYVQRDPDLDISVWTLRIEEVVDRLASVGLAHNDLHPWNILIDPELNIVSIIDWDLAGPLEDSLEYQRRVVSGDVKSSHEWDSVFRKHHSSVIVHGYHFGELDYGQSSLPTVEVHSA